MERIKLKSMNQPSALYSSEDHGQDPDTESSDGSDIVNEISQLENKILAMDLNVSSAKKNLEKVYKCKAGSLVNLADDHPTSKPSFLRRARSLFGFRIGRVSTSTTATILVNSPETTQIVLSRAEDTLQQLIRERHALTNDLSSRRTELIQRNEKLPVELWARIFLLCLPDEEFITPNTDQAPLLLCRICSQWRSVAINTPLLWNTLSIHTSWKRRIWKSSLECWLSRSGNACLHLDISIPTSLEEGTFDHHVLKAIIDTADRWHHLRLNMSINMLRSILKSPMPLLEILELYSPEHIVFLQVNPSYVPNLKTVSFLTKALYPQHLVLPWKQLTHLTTRCWLNISQHFDILSNCPNLQFYSMGLIFVDRPSLRLDTIRTLLIHRRLQSLHITSFVENITTPPVDFELFQLPRLTELTLIIANECPGYGAVNWPQNEILSLIERSSCLLSKVRFQGVIAGEEDVVSANRVIPLPTIIDFQRRL